MYDISFHWQFLAGVCSISRNNLLGQEKVFQIGGVILATEQSIKSFTFIFLGFYLNFESIFTIKKFMNNFRNDFRRTPPDGCFY